MTQETPVDFRELSKKRLRLWLKLLKASRSIEDEIRRRLRAKYNWTLPRFDVMSALSRAPDGLRMSEISRMLKVSGGNITGIVDKLVEEGLAQRMPVPGDRRAHLVRLTDQGYALFARHSIEHETWTNEILGGLDAEGVEQMIARLDVLNETLTSEEDNEN